MHSEVEKILRLSDFHVTTQDLHSFPSLKLEDASENYSGIFIFSTNSHKRKAIWRGRENFHMIILFVVVAVSVLHKY